MHLRIVKLREKTKVEKFTKRMKISILFSILRLTKEILSFVLDWMVNGYGEIKGK